MAKREPLETMGTKEPRVIAPNVREFLDSASVLYGRMQAERFSQNMFGHVYEGYLESPIEDLFWIALHVMCEAYGESLNPEPELDDGKDVAIGIWATAQQKLGPYRVDFALHRRFFRWNGKEGERFLEQPVVVELDGHDFHDKNKEQRAYEKARDRYLVSRGFRVLHFTGSEVVADPYRVAFEVLQILGVFRCFPHDFRYDPTDPTSTE